MKIFLNQVGKRFGKNWILKDFTYQFETPNRYAVLGKNGSGKSTLLRIIAQMQTVTTGAVSYELSNNHSTVKPDSSFKHIAFSAPSIELPEELTLIEFFNFHFSFKKLINNISILDLIETIGLTPALHKPIYDFSSGMKQRVKLAQAFFSDTPLLLLDEPCTNLDENGIKQYYQWIEQYTQNRIVIIASNEKKEYEFCNKIIDLGI